MDIGEQPFTLAGMAKSRKGQHPLNYVSSWRHHRNLTLEKLATVAGVTPGAINQVENRRVTLTEKMANRLAKALYCTASDLRYRHPSESPNGDLTPPDDLRELIEVYESLDPVLQERAPDVLRALKPPSKPRK